MRAPSFWAHDDWRARALMPAACAYRGAARLRAALTQPMRASVPVICVGNLVAGGAGKTPVALAIGERLRARGRRPVFLTRGYGGAEPGPLQVDPDRHDAARVGDEALLLARAAPAVVARDRVAGARLAAAHGDIIVMDDGFQNPTLAKDLNLVVVDAYGFGNGRLIPAGPLREPIAEGLRRADAVVSIDRDAPPALPVPVPVLSARTAPADSAAALRDRQLVAFAGIGRPEKFFETLAHLPAQVLTTRAFPDHHPYTESDLQGLAAEAERHAATLVTTEKDLVRVPAPYRDSCAVLAISLAWDDMAALDTLLDRCLGDGAS